MTATITIETITPAIALRWVDNKWQNQRPLRKRWVKKLAAEMKAGQFRLSTDAILLIKGLLANGQHRMQAIVDSGTSCQFIVMRSSDDELYKVIDSGLGRTVSDAITGTENATNVAAIASLVMRYDSKMLSLNVGGHNYSELLRSEQIAFMEKYSNDLQSAVSFVRPLWNQSRLLSRTIAGAFLILANRTAPKDVHPALFLSDVYKGETINASKDLRDRLIRQATSKGKFSQAYTFALVIKAWKSYINGTRPGNLKMAESEEFPEI